MNAAEVGTCFQIVLLCIFKVCKAKLEPSRILEGHDLALLADSPQQTVHHSMFSAQVFQKGSGVRLITPTPKCSTFSRCLLRTKFSTFHKGLVCLLKGNFFYAHWESALISQVGVRSQFSVKSNTAYLNDCLFVIYCCGVSAEPCFFEGPNKIVHFS